MGRRRESANGDSPRANSPCSRDEVNTRKRPGSDLCNRCNWWLPQTLSHGLHPLHGIKPRPSAPLQARIVPWALEWLSEPEEGRSKTAPLLARSPAFPACAVAVPRRACETPNSELRAPLTRLIRDPAFPVRAAPGGPCRRRKPCARWNGWRRDRPSGRTLPYNRRSCSYSTRSRHRRCRAPG